jgi:hypothetical protein
MRVDELSDVLSNLGSGDPPRHWRSARQLYLMNTVEYRKTGADVAKGFGLMLHYTRADLSGVILASGSVGGAVAGAWVTPTAYSACMAPPNLGLATPRDLALVLDVSTVPELWGPGTSVESEAFPLLWRGGGMEFYSPVPLSLDECLVDVVTLNPCGGGHR